MWLVEFLRVFFSSEELQRLAHDSLQAPSADARSAEYMLALCRAIGPMPVVRALETRALEAVLSTRGALLEEIFDMSGDDSDLASKAEWIKARKAARAILEKIFAGEEDRNVIEQMLGLPLRSKALMNLIGTFDRDPPTDLSLLRGLVKQAVQIGTTAFGALGYSQLSSAIASGNMESSRGVEDGEAAALRFQSPLLGILPRLYNQPKNAQEGAEHERLAREAIGFDPSGAFYWICLAEALIEQDRIDGALDAARKAREIASEDPNVLLRVGRVFEKSPETRAEAEATYRKVLAFEPENAQGLRALILLLAQDESSRPEAVPLARKLCALEPSDPSNWMALALTLRDEKGGEEDLLAAARRAVELAPEHSGPLAVLTVHLLRMNRIDEAVVESRKLFDRLGTKDELLDLEAKLLISVLSVWCVTDAAPALLRELDATEAAQRFRPAREALAAVVAGSSEVLNGVAPEVRKPALEILAIIAPKLVNVVNSETLAGTI